MDDSVRRVANKLGWELAVGSEIPRGRDFSLEAAVTDQGFLLIVAEARIGMGFPDYAARLRAWPGIRRRVARSIPGPTRPGDARRRAAPPTIVVYTDLARGRFAWTWMQPHPGGASRYREFRLPEAENRLRRALDADPGSLADSPTCVTRGVRAHGRLLEILFDEARRHGRRSGTVAEIVGRVRGYEKPADLHRLWRTVSRLRIVDSACRDGEWLIKAATVLELLYLVILDRMSSLEQDLSGSRHVVPGLRDVRRVLEEAEENSASGEAERFVRSRIARRHLFGFERDRALLVACRGRIAEYAGISGWSARHLNMRSSLALHMTSATTSKVAAPENSEPSKRVEADDMRHLGSAAMDISEIAGGTSKVDEFRVPKLASLQEDLEILSRGWLASLESEDGDALDGEMRELMARLEHRRRQIVRRARAILQNGNACRDATGFAVWLVRATTGGNGVITYARGIDDHTRVAGRPRRAGRPRVP